MNRCASCDQHNLIHALEEALLTIADPRFQGSLARAQGIARHVLAQSPDELCQAVLTNDDSIGPPEAKESEIPCKSTKSETAT